MERRVVVIGGGISGLAAAEAVVRHTSESGVPARVVVLEADPSPGGKIQTTTEAGCVLETGPHGFLDREPKMQALVERLGLSDSLIRANTSSARRFVIRDGHMRELPHSLWGAVMGDFLSWSGKLRLLAEPFVRQTSHPEESVYDFAARRLGKEAAEVLIDAMVTGIYGGDPRQINLKAAFPRMYDLERDHGSLVRAQVALGLEKYRQRRLGAGNVASPSSPGAPVGVLHSFKSGLGTLIHALANVLEVQSGTSVDRVVRAEGDRWKVVTGEGCITADAVISTAPAFSLPPLFGSIDTDGVDVASKIPYVACSVVVHAFRRTEVQRSVDGFGFLVPGREQRSILGSIWASTVFPVHAPDDIVMFRTMVGGARRPDLANCAPADLAAIARSELHIWMGIPTETKPTIERVIPWDKAIPQYISGHSDAVAAVDRMEKNYPGLFFGGNAYRGAAMVSCVAYGDELGQRVSHWLANQS